MEKKNNYLINITIALCSIYYFLMLIRIIILKNGFIDMGYNSNLVLFDFINQYHQSGLTKVLLVNIIGNVSIFIPLSIILRHYFSFLNNYNIAFIGFFTSLSFELIQLGTGWGVFDIDDIFLNTLGCLIGIIIYHFINQHRQNNVSTSLFLLSFGSIGLISVYNYAPLLLTTFII